MSKNKIYTKEDKAMKCLENAAENIKAAKVTFIQE